MALLYKFRIAQSWSSQRGLCGVVSGPVCPCLCSAHTPPGGPWAPGRDAGQGLRPFLWAYSRHFQYFPVRLLLYLLLFAFRRQVSAHLACCCSWKPSRPDLGHTGTSLLSPTKKATGRRRGPAQAGRGPQARLEQAGQPTHITYRSEGKGVLQTLHQTEFDILSHHLILPGRNHPWEIQEIRADLFLFPKEAENPLLCLML